MANKELTYTEKQQLGKDYKANYAEYAKKLVELKEELDLLALKRKCFYETHKCEALDNAEFYDTVSYRESIITVDTAKVKEIENWKNLYGKIQAASVAYSTKRRKKIMK